MYVCILPVPVQQTHELQAAGGASSLLLQKRIEVVDGEKVAHNVIQTHHFVLMHLVEAPALAPRFLRPQVKKPVHHRRRKDASEVGAREQVLEQPQTASIKQMRHDEHNDDMSVLHGHRDDHELRKAVPHSKC
jgi:hypothetical protein